jgi:bla regulator protein BlaR1
MSLLEQYGSPALMRALGWTLLHSVWQGALVALTAATLLMLLHRHAAALRYRVAAGAMLMLLVLSGLTFGYYYASFHAGSSSVAEAGATVWSATAPADVAPVPENGVVLYDGNGAMGTDALTPLEEPSRLQQLLQTSKTYLERNMPFVVVAWLLGMLAMTLRFLGGLAYVQRLRRYRVAALPAEWQTRLDELAARTNLRRPVQILASGLVPGPLVIGWLKPVVLLPMSAASGLSGSELEAILAHELAHVMRRDYLFNLLQSVAEILFFYHPAVWFLSGCLRTERENCCDDIATELCGDSLVLAQALASLAALQHTQSTFTPRMAMAAAGQPGSLLSRVRRLVQHRAAAPTFSDGFWAACVVLLSVGLLTVTTVLSLSAASFSTPAAATVHDASTPMEAEAAKEMVSEAPDAAPEPNGYEPGESQLLDDTVVVYAQSNPKLLTKSGKAKLNEIKGLTVVVKDESGAISEVYVDGKKVPAADLPAYREALAKTEAAKSTAKTRVVTGQSQQDRMTVLSNRMASAALSGNSPSAADAEELSKLAMGTARISVQMSQLNGDIQQMEKSFKAAEKDIIKELNQKNLSEEKIEALQESLQELREQHIEQVEEIRLAEDQDRRDEEQDHRDADQARRDEQQARRDADQARRDVDQTRRNAEQARRDKEQAAWHKALLSELTKDGLIRDPNNFSFSLSQKSLTSDGKKQSDALRNKYLKLYENYTGRKLSATGSINIVEQRDSNSTVAYDDMPPAPPAPPAPGTPMAPSLPRVPRTPSVPRAPSALRAPAAPRPPRAPEDRSERVREALWQDGLLEKSEKSFSLQLNSKGLIVDGKQQSAALADKYRKLLGVTDAKNSKSTINITVSE